MLETLNTKKVIRELLYRDYAIIKPRGALVEVILSNDITQYNITIV